MAFSKDGRIGFSNGGFRIRRVNPDGSYPAVDRQLGFVGTVDLTSNSTAKEELYYRWDGKGDFTKMEIDLTSAGATITAVKVAELVTKLNEDTNFKAVFLSESDVDTGRLLIKDKDDVSTHKYLELKGNLAIVLGFGQFGDAGAMGTAFFECFDRSGAFSFPKETKEGEEIEQESSLGGIDTMVVDSQLKGINPTVALNAEYYELKLMVQGGDWDETNSVYTPPTTAMASAPLVAGEFFEPKYQKGHSHRGDKVAYKLTSVPRMTGSEGDLATEVKAWATYQFDFKAREYTDIDGVLKPAYTEKDVTVAEAIAMGITN